MSLLWSVHSVSTEGITIYVPVVDMGQDVVILMQATSKTRGIRRGGS